MDEIVGILNGIVWSEWLIYLCLGAGIYFSLITRFLQVRYLTQMPK